MDRRGLVFTGAASADCRESAVFAESLNRPGAAEASTDAADNPRPSPPPPPPPPARPQAASPPAGRPDSRAGRLRRSKSDCIEAALQDSSGDFTTPNEFQADMEMTERF